MMQGGHRLLSALAHWEGTIDVDVTAWAANVDEKLNVPCILYTLLYTLLFSSASYSDYTTTNTT